MMGAVETSDLVIVPVDLYITRRWGGVYYGGEVPEGRPRQEPDSFERIHVSHVVYIRPQRWESNVRPHWVIPDDGVWLPLTDAGGPPSHWYFDLGPHSELRGTEK